MPNQPRAARGVLALGVLLSLSSLASLAVVTFALTNGCATDTIDLAVLPVADAGPDGPPTFPPCIDNSGCLPDYYCSLPACDSPAGTRGTCTLPPATCYDDGLPPVCGCDHVTYYNDCLRQRNFVASSTKYPCQNNPKNPVGPCGEGFPGSTDCPVGALCAQLGVGPPGSDACDHPIPGTCWVLPDQCPATTPQWDTNHWDSCMPGDGGCLDTCNAIIQGGTYRDSVHHCP